MRSQSLCRYMRVLIDAIAPVFPDLTFIFVVNHLLNDTDVVEKFRFDEKTRKLHHVRTYEDDTPFTLPVTPKTITQSVIVVGTIIRFAPH